MGDERIGDARIGSRERRLKKSSHRARLKQQVESRDGVAVVALVVVVLVVIGRDGWVGGGNDGGGWRGSYVTRSSDVHAAQIQAT